VRLVRPRPNRTGGPRARSLKVNQSFRPSRGTTKAREYFAELVPEVRQRHRGVDLDLVRRDQVPDAVGHARECLRRRTGGLRHALDRDDAEARRTVLWRTAERRVK